jgi:predicted nucleotidyltransferase
LDKPTTRKLGSKTNPMNTKIELPMEQIKAFCQKWQVTELALFGSVLRDDFRSDSDIDILITLGCY